MSTREKVNVSTIMIVFQLIVPLALLHKILESSSEGAHDLETVFIRSNKAAWKKNCWGHHFKKVLCSL